jgi:hypothetical protein
LPLKDFEGTGRFDAHEGIPANRQLHQLELSASSRS